MEVLFYHLQNQTLENVLPQLLEKSLERGWKAIVRFGSEERLAALDDHLWTWRDNSFLAHGTSTEGQGDKQPVYLSLGTERPNAANVLFLVDGALHEEFRVDDGYQRIVLIFDGNEEEHLKRARDDWARIKKAGLDASYWQTDENGRWSKKA